MHVAFMQQFAAHSFTGSSLEQHVIRHHHRRATVDLEQ
jgi:hypothetical protein